MKTNKLTNTSIHIFKNTTYSVVAFAILGVASTYGSAIAYRDAVLAHNPYLFYMFGEASGTTATDSSGNARNGTYHDLPTLGVTDPWGGNSAVRLDGTNQSVSITGANMAAYGPALGNTATSGGTFESWVKTTQTAQTFLFGFNGTGGNGTILSVRLNATDGYIEAWVRDDNISGQQLLKGIQFDANFNDGNWNHLAVTWNKGNAVSVFLNATSLSPITSTASGLVTGSDLITSTDVSYIGRRAAGNYYSGDLSGFALYDYTLSEAQVQAHYNAIPEPQAMALVVALIALLVIPLSRRIRSGQASR